MCKTNIFTVIRLRNERLIALFLLKIQQLYMNKSNTNLADQLDLVFQENCSQALKNTPIIYKECRICLEQQNSTNNDSLIAPCHCSGSVKFVHFRCMSMWIEKNSKIPMCEIEKINKFVCEMCKTHIQFQCQHQIICHKWSEFLSVVKKQICNFIILTLLALISFILGCVGITFLLVWSRSMNFNDNPSLIIIICVIMAFIFFGISIFMWIKQYGVIIKTKIIRIGAIIQNKGNLKQSQLTTEQLRTDGNRNIFTSKKIFPIEILEQNSRLM